MTDIATITVRPKISRQRFSFKVLRCVMVVTSISDVTSLMTVVLGDTQEAEVPPTKENSIIVNTYNTNVSMTQHVRYTLLMQLVYI